MKSASTPLQTLTGAHFESQVAKTVFNDRNQPPRNPAIQRAELLVVQWLEHRAQPRQFMRMVSIIDRTLFPHMSATMMRQFSRLVCEIVPQALPNAPNTRAHVEALTRAVHMSKFLHPDALDRILVALQKEGLSASKGDSAS